MTNSKIKADRLRKQALLTPTGATAPNGIRLVQVDAGGPDPVSVPLAEFRGTGKAAGDRLAADNVVVLSDAFKKLQAAVAALTDFPPRPLATRPGWSGSLIALPSGHIVGADADDGAKALYPPIAGRDGVSGDLESWKRGVMAPLIGQPLPTFIMMFPFVAPLLSLIDHPTNFGFELAGPSGTGKTTLCRLAASVVGPMDSAMLGRNAVMGATDELMEQCRDFPMMFDDGAMMPLLAGVTGVSRAADLVMKLGSGQARQRPGKPPSEPSRFVWLSPTNRSLPTELASLPRSTTSGAFDCMITLGLERERPLGVFDHLPDGYASAAAFADTLVASARQHHGHAYRTYLERLAEARVEDEAKLVAFIHRKVAQIVDTAESGARDRFDRRVAEAFGLVFAAGRLARRYDVLPRELGMLEAVTQAYGLHRASRRAVASPIDQLLELSRSDKLLDLRGIYDSATPVDLEAADGILKSGIKGDELLLTRAQMRRLTSDPTSFMKDPEVRRAAVRDGGHNMVYRVLPRLYKSVRYYVFSMDILIEFDRS